MGAKHDAYVTVDPAQLARGAAGICAAMDDLGAVGQLLLNGGYANGQSIIPEHWVADTMNQGDPQAWSNGNFSGLLPGGCYRNQWYQVRDSEQCVFAFGVHGQWLFVNPTRRTVVVKLSSQQKALHKPTDLKSLEQLKALSRL